MSLHYMIRGVIIKGFLSNHNKHMRYLVRGDMKLYNNVFSTCIHTYEQATEGGLNIGMWEKSTQEEIDIFKTVALLQGVDL